MTLSYFQPPGGGVLEASGYGLGLMPVSPNVCTVANALAAQVFAAVFAVAPAKLTVNKLGVWIFRAGVTPGAGINALAIYSAAGLLLGQTGDMTAAFETAGTYSEAAISGGGVALAAGTGYYLAILSNFTGTTPSVPGTSTAAALPVIRGQIPSAFLAAQAAFPASFNPAAGANSGAYFLTAGP